ncbi:MAG: hypothetical protein R2795_17215 [Saprospiraceae bacterium]
MPPRQSRGVALSTHSHTSASYGMAPVPIAHAGTPNIHTGLLKIS